MCSARDFIRSRYTHNYYNLPTPLDEGTSLEDAAWRTDPVLTALTELAALKLGCDRAMVTLLDHRYQYSVAESSKHGNPFFRGMQLHVRDTLCQYTIRQNFQNLQRAPFYRVPDLSVDPRTKDRGYVQSGPCLKSYIGLPLITPSGVIIGALCVLDNKPWPELSEENAQTLRDVAHCVVGHLQGIADKKALELNQRMQASIASFVSRERRVDETTQEMWRSACHEIRKALDVDQMLFLDAERGIHGAQSTNMDAEILATSKSEVGRSHKIHKLSFRTLLDLIERYPRGYVFYLGDESAKDGMSDDIQTNKELDAFLPNAHTLVVCPIWNASKSVIACAIVASSDATTLFDDQTLLYITGFATHVLVEMSEREMSLADKAKGDFISSISHELRSPLHGVLASAEFLQDTKLDPFQQSFVDTIDGCGRSLLHTINNVLDFQKLRNIGNRGNVPGEIKSESVQSVVERTDVVELVEEVVEAVFAGYEFKQKNHTSTNQPDDEQAIDILFEFEKADSWTFWTQSGALRRILINLLGNSLKYTTKGFVRIKLFMENQSSALSMVTLVVADTGKGIGKDFLKTQLFCPFVQEDALQPGTGLGMSIIKQLVSLLKGTIYVDSEEGVGTEVRVTIPMERRTRRLSMQSIFLYKPTRAGKVKLLGFEKRETVGAHLCDYMRDWFGWEIVVDTHEADLILAHEGAELLEKLRLRTTGEIVLPPLVIMCSNNAKFAMYKYLMHDNCFTHVISEPCGPAKLVKALKAYEIWNGERAFQSRMQSPVEGLPTDAISMQRDNSIMLMADIPNEGKLRTEDILSPIISPASDARLHRPIVEQPNLLSVTQGLTLSDASSRAGSFGSTMGGNLSPASAESRSVASPSHTAPDAQEPIFLVVEDNPVNLMLLTTWLRKQAMSFDNAENGKIAVDCVTSRKDMYDIILMDIQMPVMNGIEATQRIRAIEKERGRPRSLIIALTGLNSAQDQAACSKAGVDLFMTKPVSFKEVGKQIEEWKLVKRNSRTRPEK